MSTTPLSAIVGNQTSDSGEALVQAYTAEFPPASNARSGQRLALERFLDVQVEVTVEIGRMTTTLGELLNLGVGAVIELDRNVSEPVDVIAQGAKIGNGEIIVVDDHFAVKLIHVESGTESSPPASGRSK